MWIREVTKRDRALLSRAVVQVTRAGVYMSVQDKYGAILGTARWEGRIKPEAVSKLLGEAKIYPDAWRRPRPGVWVTDVRDGV